MKKILTTILVFLGFLTLGVTLSVNAAVIKSYDYAFTSQQFEANGSKTLGGIEWTLSGDEGYLGYDTYSDPSKGQQFGSSKKPFKTLSLKSASIENVTKVSVFASGGSKISANISISIGTDSSTATALTASTAEYTHSVTTPVSGAVNISMTQTSSKAMYISKIQIWTDATNYKVTFDAAGGTFAAGKGTEVTVPVEETKEVTLPTSEDLAKTKYANCSVLSKWTDGTNEYNPGAKVTVSSATTFSAIYVAPADPKISMTDAISICEEVGSARTDFKFSVQGEVVKVQEEKKDGTVKGYSAFITDGTNEMEAYYLTDAENLGVGDTVIVTGVLTKYYDTYEFASGCTYKMVKVAAIDNFPKAVTKSTLKVTYGDDLIPTDVDLRVGGVIAANAYNPNATYGVLVVEGTKTLTAGATSYADVAAFLAANAGFKNMACTPVAVTDGYQFAWVITDMEGHYDTPLTAVMYMVYDGVLYICSSKTTSVRTTVNEYLNNASLGLTDDQKTVLNRIIA